MRIDLSGKRAVVTGSTGGIGYAIAKGLAGAGASVVVNGRKQDRVDAAISKLKKEVEGAGIEGVAADLGSAEGCKALIDAVPETDILVNNVGLFGPKDFFDTPDDLWEQYFAVNVMSGVRLSRAYLKGMEKRGWGRVLFLSSESAFNVPAAMIHYGVTKTADSSLARGLAKRMAGTGVTVNSILPGPTFSEGVSEMLREQAEEKGQTIEEAGIEFVKSERPSSIIQRPASVEEVANLAVYVASPLSSATTGAALRVDGGVVDTIA
ncbi:SDR family NAD(P)-dependent oxidoreductase [Pararhizobium mangrovi]|uniref:SDR family oxidoreductase n=1 Tax=Pararhizobium mangrovi TaxID=2590452 RepID=A0A506UBI0_9HYPH|nr:SDR family oxidoreductase [Pararhizobium mangrovi]TPW31300.1 SDR family oxidoreductase [Pararhizobium mangrovi]